MIDFVSLPFLPLIILYKKGDQMTEQIMIVVKYKLLYTVWSEIFVALKFHEKSKIGFLYYSVTNKS